MTSVSGSFVPGNNFYSRALSGVPGGFAGYTRDVWHWSYSGSIVVTVGKGPIMANAGFVGFTRGGFTPVTGSQSGGSVILPLSQFDGGFD